MISIYSRIQNKFFRSTNSLTKINELIACNQWTHNLPKIRCLSTKTTPKITDIKQFPRKTNKTIDPIKHLTKNNEENEENLEKSRPKVETMGIIGIHNWDDMKNVGKWVCVYHFPYIAYLQTFQRLKLWITVFNCAFVPVSFALYSSGSFEIDVVTYYTMVGMFSMFGMYIFGHLFSRYVGRIYVSDNRKFVRLSHLSFFGHRMDTDFEREDIVPLMDTNVKLDDWYCAIERYSTSNHLYMSLKYGGIVNREAFEQVFGEESIKFLVQNKRI